VSCRIAPISMTLSDLEGHSPIVISCVIACLRGSSAVAELLVSITSGPCTLYFALPVAGSLWQ